MKKLLKKLRENDITLNVADGQLKVFAGSATPDAALINEIRERKAELIQFLSSNDQGSFRDTFQLNIPAVPVQESYPLSSVQRRLWLASQFEASSVAYNTQKVFVFEGRLDLESLQNAMDSLMHRHESLRTVFRTVEGGGVRQFIRTVRETGFKISFRDVRHREDPEGYLREVMGEEGARPFNLETGPLLRILICQAAEDRYIFSYVMHHIISDGWSMNIMISELLQFYNAYTINEPYPLQPLRIHYKDYATWQQEQLSGETLAAHRAYWLNHFGGELPVMELPGDRPRPAIKTYNGGMAIRAVSAETGRRFSALCREQGGTLFMGLVAALNTLLYKYSGQEDIVIGSPIAGREHTDLENQIGCYLNTIALRTQFSGAQDFRTLLDNVRTVTLGAYEHQVYPFDELIDALELKRDMSRSPLFDVMLNLAHAKVADAGAPGGIANIIVSPFDSNAQVVSKFDLTFFVSEVNEGFSVNLAYNSDLFDRATMDRLLAHLDRLLAMLPAAADMPIRQLSFLSAEEREQVTATFSRSSVSIPAGKTIADLFEEQAARTPGSNALAFEGRTLSYEALNEKADRLAHYLQTACGIGPDDLVGIMLDRSEHMIVALMGILKAGGAYVAIDPENPPARKEYIIGDTAIKALITQTDYLFDLPYYDGHVFAIDIQLDGLEEGRPQRTATTGHLAYVLYTSGSTGQPKGVMITHGALVDYVYGILDRTNMAECGSFGLVSTIAADLGNTVLYTALLTGGTLHVFSAADVTNPVKMQQARVDCLKIVPSHWKALQAGGLFAPAKCLVFGGEQLTTDVIGLLRSGNAACQVYNHYGPSETTIGKLTRNIDIQDPNLVISLGSPFGDTRIYVLDAALNPVPVGVPGEICIGGRGLSRGYINNPALTAEKFVADPFIPAERIYRTGDVGRWLTDGTVQFMGRSDDQVKVRGYRIELGEIERTLRAQEGVTAAVVIARTNNEGENELVAYLVYEGTFNKTGMQAALSATLPAYMLPAQYIELDALPLTANGKINRKALPDPAGFEAGAAYVAPRTPTEEKLVLLWQDVLGKERIGIKDNFFEMGGHSLRATRLSSLIHKEFDVNLGLKELFDSVVLEEQARLIDEAGRSAFEGIEPVEENGDYVLSSSQRRLWVLSQFEDGNAAYNVPGVYVFEGALDRAALERSFLVLIGRHESLRTVFRENERKEVRQYIRTAQELGFAIGYHDLRGIDAQEENLKEQVHAEFVKKFDLANGPLVRINLHQVAVHKWVLTYVTHHIISDGFSKGILIGELLALYNAFTQGEENPLSPLRIQYKDYAAWQQKQLSGEALEAHRDYWMKHFEGELPVLDLPTEKIRPALKTYNGASFGRSLPRHLGEGMRTLCQQEGGSLFMGMMAAVNALFYRYTGEEDIIIGTPVAGRDHIDLQNQIGFYANTVALRTQFSGGDTYRELLRNVKEKTLSAFAHQLYPFDTLVSELKIQRDMSRNPLFDVQVIVENAATAAGAGLGDVSVSSYAGSETHTSVFEMVLFFAETEQDLRLSIVYNSDVYDRRSVERLANHLEGMLAAIVATPDRAIRDLGYLGAHDRDTLLNGFNHTALQRDGSVTILDLFAAQAAARPDAAAVTFGGRTLTYRELDEQSNRLAHYLRTAYGVQREQLVGVMLERSEKLIVALLGILKAGGVYVPVDPAYPTARKQFMIGDTGVQVLITQTDYVFDLDYFSGHMFAIDIQLETLDTPADACAAGVRPEDLAYVIYTSGSTGQPKGVMIGHGALSASIQAQRTIFNIEAGTRCMQFTSSSFDVSIFETFIALVSGGLLCIIQEDDKKEPFLLERFIHTNNIEVASIPPAYLRLLNVENIPGLKKLITGGEAASMETVRAFSRGGTYYNAYGPTESSLCATVFAIGHDTVLSTPTVPIGRPIPFIEIYVTDERNNLVPAGVTGELYIGGAGLGRGYLNRPELTAERFVVNPFRAGERMYKTGDLGRWLPDGNLEFIGRADDQVKVNGYRIELGEVEKAVQSHDDIDSAIVIARPNRNGDNQLVAYLVSTAEIKTADLLKHLSKSLPSYMLPAHFVQLETLPLTTNGKVDRKKLPNPEGIGLASGMEYVAPRNDDERKMVRIWEELLGREGIGVRESFFELGGDSIKILRMTTEMKRELALDIPITDIYKNNTIESMLAHAAANRTEIDARNRRVHEQKEAVMAEVEALKQRILDGAQELDRDNIEDIYPMSDIEKGMVYESLLHEKLRIYHDQIVQRRQFVHFDIARFRQAINLMVEKHPILRTSFNLADFETEVQIVHRNLGDLVEYQDLSELSRPEQEARVRNFMQLELDRPFRFGEAPLWRMNVYNFGNDEIIFVFQTHHAIIDGWSDASFMTEVNNIYLELGRQPSFRPEPLKASYKDYVINHLIEKRIDEVKDFWRNELAGYSRLDLFGPENDFIIHAGFLDRKNYKKLEDRATELKTTVKVLALSAYLYLLKILNGEQEVLAGLVINNRPNCEDGDKILGCFLNTIPLRMQVDGNASCADFIGRVHAKSVELKNYEGLSVPEIAQLNNRGMASGNPFFDMIFSYVDFHTYDALAGDDAPQQAAAPAEPLGIGNYGRTNTYFDLSVNVTGGRFTAGLKFTKKLRSGLSVHRVGALYMKLIHHIIDNPYQSLQGLELVDETEKTQLLHTFNDSATNYPRHSTVAELFHEQVAKTPGATALVFEEQVLTYAQLNETANRLANHLAQTQEVRPGEIVAVKLERSAWVVIAQLALLKIGAAYLAIDPGYPQERIDYMLNDGGCRVVIDDAELERFQAAAAAYDTANPDFSGGADDLAYIMYTSGSTGGAKGVMVSHRGIVRLARNINHVQVHQSDRMICLSNFVFDGSTFDIYAALLNGAMLVVVPHSVLFDAMALSELIARHQVSLFFIPTALFNLLSESDMDLSSVRRVIIGGEALSVTHTRKFGEKHPDVQLFNGYGPTENTTFSTCYPIGTLPADARSIPLGGVISDTTAYILDDSGNLCPIGLPGEICLGGDGLAKGYLNRPELTAARFVPNPFLPGGMMYRTGDVGRWLPDGIIEYLGRRDDQVKIRGYRIEMGEIENVLLTHPQLSSAVVVAREGAQGKELVAYYIAKEGEECTAATLRAHLSATLPPYMLPGLFVPLDEFPLSANGKVDKRRLPEPQAEATTAQVYVAPRNETEETLARIWENILDVKNIGMHDNFFESGGHSLRAMKLVARIHKELNILLKVEDLFRHPTIEGMAKELARRSWARRSEEPGSEPVSEQSFII